MAIINVMENQEDVLQTLKTVLSRNANTTIKHAIIRYDQKKGIPDQLDYHNYPLQLVGKLGEGTLVIRVLNVTAGSEDEGSKLLREILTYLKFNFKDEEIFTRANSHDDFVRLVYVKEDILA